VGLPMASAFTNCWQVLGARMRAIYSGALQVGSRDVQCILGCFGLVPGLAQERAGMHMFKLTFFGRQMMWYVAGIAHQYINSREKEQPGSEVCIFCIGFNGDL
jgi:hypothetical protein